MKTKSIIVIGGGVVGLSVAYYALLQGHRVTLLERNAPNHESCSLGNAGLISPSHFVPLAAPGMVALGLRLLLNPEGPFGFSFTPDLDRIDWAWKFYCSATKNHVARTSPLLRDMLMRSRAEYVRFAENGNMDFGLERRGLLMLCKTDHALQEERELVEMAHRLGVEAELLNRLETANRDPKIQMDVAGSVYFPQDCHLTPSRFVAGLTKLVQDRGGTILWNQEVVGYKVNNKRMESVLTHTDEMNADEYVFTGGAWTSALAKQVGIYLPMQAGKGYNITLEAPHKKPDLSSILVEARVAVTPMGESLRFAGTMEITGTDLAVNQRRVNGIIKSIPDYLPDYKITDFQDRMVWSGLRPCTPDGLPYIGRFRGWSNLSVAAGHAMLGLSMAPISGILMSEILSDIPASLPLDYLRPERFGN